MSILCLVTSVYIAVATCKPPNDGPVHCDLLICGPGTTPVRYICSVTYRDGVWPADYKITKYWCGVLTCAKRSVHERHLAQKIHRHILTRNAVSQTGQLVATELLLVLNPAISSAFSDAYIYIYIYIYIYGSHLESVRSQRKTDDFPSMRSTYQNACFDSAVLLQLEATTVKGKTYNNTWTLWASFIRMKTHEMKINFSFLVIKSRSSSGQKRLPMHTKFTSHNTQQFLYSSNILSH